MPRRRKPSVRLERALAWLEERLPAGAAEATAVLAEAAAAGISERTLRRAKALLKVESSLSARSVKGAGVTQYHEWAPAGTRAAEDARYQALVKAVGRPKARRR